MNKWISLQEKEPKVDNDKTILVWTNYGARFAMYKENGLQVYSMGKESKYAEMFEVTHWMDIPEPPKQ